LREPVDLDGLDIGQAALAELLEEVRAGVVRGSGLVLHDLDAGLVGERPEAPTGGAEVVDGGDRKGRVVAGLGRRVVRGGAGTAGEHERRGGGDAGYEADATQCA